MTIYLNLWISINNIKFKNNHLIFKCDACEVQNDNESLTFHMNDRYKSSTITRTRNKISFDLIIDCSENKHILLSLFNDTFFSNKEIWKLFETFVDFTEFKTVLLKLVKGIGPAIPVEESWTTTNWMDLDIITGEKTFRTEIPKVRYHFGRDNKLDDDSVLSECKLCKEYLETI